MISTPLVLWAGHFMIGLAYYWRFHMFKTKEEAAKDKEEVLQKYPAHQVEMAERLMKNKWLILVLYMIVGYFNILYHVSRMYKKIIKKGVQK